MHAATMPLVVQQFDVLLTPYRFGHSLPVHGPGNYDYPLHTFAPYFRLAWAYSISVRSPCRPVVFAGYDICREGSSYFVVGPWSEINRS